MTWGWNRIDPFISIALALDLSVICETEWGLVGLWGMEVLYFPFLSGKTPASMGFPRSSAGKEFTCNVGDPPWRRDRLPTPVFLGFPGGSEELVKNLLAKRETWVWSLGWEDPWRRERLPTSVFCPGESHGLYGPWGRKESDTTDRLIFQPPWPPGEE